MSTVRARLVAVVVVVWVALGVLLASRISWSHYGYEPIVYSGTEMTPSSSGQAGLQPWTRP